MDTSTSPACQPWPETFDEFVNYDGYVADDPVTEIVSPSMPHKEVKDLDNGIGTRTFLTNEFHVDSTLAFSSWTYGTALNELLLHDSCPSLHQSLESTPSLESPAPSTSRSPSREVRSNPKMLLSRPMLYHCRNCKRGGGFYTKEGLE